MEKQERHSFTIEISKDMHKKLKSLAVNEGKSMRFIVEELINALLCKNELSKKSAD